MSNIVIANFQTGFETDKAPFLINNDAFPEINNAFVWRDRLKKKRGVSQLGQLERSYTAFKILKANGTDFEYSTINGINTLNLFSALLLSSSEPGASLVPGDLSNITITFGAPISQSLTNATNTRFMIVVGVGPILSAQINFSTGIITIISNAPVGPATVTVTLSYYPRLPVMGIRQFNQNFTGASTPDKINFPLYVFFDTKYSYIFSGVSNIFKDVNLFFGTGARFTWSGKDYQQFWTANYQGAMFATNNVPGFNFLTITSITVGNPTTFTTAADIIQTGDWIFINEVLGTDKALLNNQTVQATRTGAGTFTIPINTTAKVITSPSGIVQLLTRSNGVANQDGIKYFIGDPSSGATTKGWVNFAPPLSNAAAPSYLVGAKLIIPFKNRLLFFATWTQTSTGAAIYNPNQLVACQNGTVFYANTGLPPNQTADATSFYQNVVGKGLRLNAPISQEIICANQNNDVVIVIFENQPLKLYSTGDDSAPFLYQTISTEFGAMSTFSAVPLDAGMLSIGPYGFALTDQNSARRFDLPIPDQVFNINRDDNGINRVCAIRDFRNEFVYFTFPTNGNSAGNDGQLVWIFPTTTLAFNYRDNLWSTFTESYTAYGNFKKDTDYTWADLTELFGTWGGWSNPWNFGGIESKYPFIACGNQQGFVMFREESTEEGQSQYIKAITITGVGIGTVVTITSPNHNLNDGDYILITGALGMTNMNDVIFSISAAQGQADTFTLFLTESQLENLPSGTYIGGGTYSRLTNINILTKQFPLGWQDGRQTRLGTQRYLLTTTSAGQITADLYVNQNNNFPANTFQYSPYLPFSNVLLTCFEGNDLNLTQGDQDQIWHRINTSVIGDTVQVGFTLSDAQMRDPTANQEEIELFAIILSVAPGPTLAF